MSSVLAQGVVMVLGGAVLVLSAWGILQPGKLIKLVTSVLDQKWGLYFGVVVRLVLGAALITSAPISSFPLVFEVLGYLAILAALALIIVGHERTRKIIGWFAQLRTPAIRLWLLFGMAFGGFLVYGLL